MKRTLSIYCFLFLCLHFFGQNFSNPQAIELIRQGRLNLESASFQEALEDFATAAKLPLHNRSAQASYLAGLASYYSNDYTNAVGWFNYMIQTFPATSYASEAVYHKGLAALMLGDLQNQVSGLQDLFFLYENIATPIDLRTSALSAIRHYTFYELEPSVMEYMLPLATTGQAPILAEALCSRYVEANQQYAAQRVANSLQAKGIPLTSFMMKLLGPQSRVHYYEPNLIKLALMLPMYLPANDNAKADPKGAIGRDFYEGFRLATSDFQQRSRKRIYLKVYDTKRSPELAERQLTSLESLYPDMILGDIFNTPSLAISNWCHERGIPQISPLSPTLDQSGKPLLLLGHPSVETHGAQMAYYARQKLNLNKIVVWTDGRRITERIANAYASTFAQLGGEVTWVRLDSTFSKARGQILKYITTRARTEKPDGHYIPLPSEEMCGLILSELNFRRMKHTILGSPNWQYFEAIDRGLMERYKLVFSTSYFINEDDPIYKAFAKRFKADFKRRPSADHIQGYDFGQYVLSILDNYDFRQGVTLDQYIRNYGQHNGFHINFKFNGRFDNQLVHICKFNSAGFEKLN